MTSTSPPKKTKWGFSQHMVLTVGLGRFNCEMNVDDEQINEAIDDEGRLWIFGYGSLVWRPAFAHVAQHVARIEGGRFKRRFWQGSPDHRGTPEALGRVVTLVPSETAQEHDLHNGDEPIWGRVYAVAPEHREQTLAYLDHREQGGYSRELVTVYIREEGSVADEQERSLQALVYMATVENEHFIGPDTVEAMARQIAISHGPSGSNREYLIQLAEALRHIGAHDSHVHALEYTVLNLK